ncbi:hypothetical protein D3C77_142810 [compost metagenome]
MRSEAKVEKDYLYSKPVDFRKSIDGRAALVELDIKVAEFDPVLLFCSSGTVDSKICRLTGIVRRMMSMPEDLPDEPVLLKQMLLETLSRQEQAAEA